MTTALLLQKKRHLNSIVQLMARSSSRHLLRESKSNFYKWSSWTMVEPNHELDLSHFKYLLCSLLNIGEVKIGIGSTFQNKIRPVTKRLVLCWGRRYVPTISWCSFRNLHFINFLHANIMDIELVSRYFCCEQEANDNLSKSIHIRHVCCGARSLNCDIFVKCYNICQL